MLYNNFIKNYDEFKEMFYDASGRKRNRVELAFTLWCMREYIARYKAQLFTNCRCVSYTPFVHKNMFLRQVLSKFNRGRRPIEFRVGGNSYYLYNGVYESDEHMCIREDCGDGMRLMRDGRVLGVKFGKVLNACNDALVYKMPQCVVNYAAELLADAWRAEYGEKNYELRIDDDFEAIYSVAGMGSCMYGSEQWSFYRDAVDASAC